MSENAGHAIESKDKSYVHLVSELFDQKTQRDDETSLGEIFREALHYQDLSLELSYEISYDHGDYNLDLILTDTNAVDIEDEEYHDLELVDKEIARRQITLSTFGERIRGTGKVATRQHYRRRGLATALLLTDPKMLKDFAQRHQDVVGDGKIQITINAELDPDIEDEGYDNESWAEYMHSLQDPNADHEVILRGRNVFKLIKERSNIR